MALKEEGFEHGAVTKGHERLRWSVSSVGAAYEAVKSLWAESIHFKKIPDFGCQFPEKQHPNFKSVDK